MKPRNHLLAGLPCMIGFSITAAAALADDFAPPPWDRAHPQAITAEWEFLATAAPLSPIAPDGPLTNVGAKGGGSVPGGSFAAVAALAVWEAGGWTFLEEGVGLHFEIDNIIDEEPVKFMYVQITHNPGALLEIDTLPEFNPGEPTVADKIPFDATHTLFRWEIYSNPDWEEFDLLVGKDAHIDQVLVDTISIPEPSALSLVVLGLMSLSLIGAGRRRRA